MDATEPCCSECGQRAAALTEPLDAPFPTDLTAYPPIDWFMPSDLARSGRLTITDEGRVGGYFYPRDECIIDGSDDCWKPPYSPSGYQLFHQGDVVTQDGTLHQLFVGAIGNTRGHFENDPASVAIEKYANPDAQLIVARAYDDERGGYIAGSLVPGVTYGDVALLRRSALSGDWRSFRHGDLVGRAAAAADGWDCIGPTLVTRPGLPMFRRVAAVSGIVILGGKGGVDEEVRAAPAPEITEEGKAAAMDPHEFVDEDGDGKCDVCGMTAAEHDQAMAAAVTAEPVSFPPGTPLREVRAWAEAQLAALTEPRDPTLAEVVAVMNDRMDRMEATLTAQLDQVQAAATRAAAATIPAAPALPEPVANGV